MDFVELILSFLWWICGIFGFMGIVERHSVRHSVRTQASYGDLIHIVFFFFFVLFKVCNSGPDQGQENASKSEETQPIARDHQDSCKRNKSCISDPQKEASWSGEVTGRAE